MTSTRKSKSLRKAAPVLFAITGNGKGAVSVAGKRVIFRLHHDGRVEYDRPHRFERRFRRRQYQIGAGEIQEIMELAERQEFLTLAEHYPHRSGMRRCYAVTDLVIEYKNESLKKRIRISDYQGGRAAYPTALSEMLGKVFEIHRKNCAKQ